MPVMDWQAVSFRRETNSKERRALQLIPMLVHNGDGRSNSTSNASEILLKPVDADVYYLTAVGRHCGSEGPLHNDLEKTIGAMALL